VSDVITIIRFQYSCINMCIINLSCLLHEISACFDENKLIRQYNTRKKMICTLMLSSLKCSTIMFYTVQQSAVCILLAFCCKMRGNLLFSVVNLYTHIASSDFDPLTQMWALTWKQAVTHDKAERLVREAGCVLVPRVPDDRPHERHLLLPDPADVVNLDDYRRQLSCTGRGGLAAGGGNGWTSVDLLGLSHTSPMLFQCCCRLHL